MKRKNRIVVAALLVLAWLCSVTFARAWLVPATGAATVMQLDASNTTYVAAMEFVTATSMATVGISVVFAILIYLVLRSK